MPWTFVSFYRNIFLSKIDQTKPLNALEKKKKKWVGKEKINLDVSDLRVWSKYFKGAMPGGKDAFVEWCGCTFLTAFVSLYLFPLCSVHEEYVCTSKATHSFTAVNALNLSCKLAVPVYWCYWEQTIHLICFRGHIPSTEQLCLVFSASSNWNKNWF